MAAKSSLEPRYSESRARSRRKAWYILIPPHLSETGKEQRPYYETKKAAMLDAQRLQHRSDNFGLSLNALTPARIALANEAFNLIDPLGLDLLTVVRDGLAVHKRRTMSVPFLELFNLYLGLKPRDREYQKALTWIRDRYPQLHKHLACDITAADLERLLRPLSIGARQPIMRYWRAVFNLGEKRGFLPRGSNPINAMHFVQTPRKEVEIINNEHVKKMLEHALENDLELLPFLVLGFFCGIRPAGELTQVLWRDVHLDGEKPEVIIRATVSKTRRMRAIELSPNAVAWLNVYRAQGGGMDGLIVKLKRYGLEGRRNVNWRAAAGKRIKWIQDGMRHTFCSNWLAFHEKIDRLVLISGHDSVDTMWQHYYKGTTKAAAAAFWNLYPPAINPENVVRFPIAEKTSEYVASH
jgi:integrase